jgi:hypothetical protein
LGGVPCRQGSGEASRGKEADCKEGRCKEIGGQGFTESGGDEDCDEETSEED